MFTEILILQCLVLSCIGASIRVLWLQQPNDEPLSSTSFVKKISMPILITIGLLLVTEGKLGIIELKSKTAVWGYSLLASFFGHEVYERILGRIRPEGHSEENATGEDNPDDKKKKSGEDKLPEPKG